MSGDIIRWASQNRLLALLLCGLFVACGGWSLATLPIDAVPDVTNVQVQVVTRAPALSASELETNVTQLVERAMAGTPHLVLTRSITKFGISIVTLIFSDDTDVYFARQQVTERLGVLREQIPPNIGQPELGPIATGLGEIYMFELKPLTEAARSDEELRTIVEWQIAPRLRRVPGVIEVIGYGGALKQYRVTLDPQRLSAHGISVADVRGVLERDNQVAGGGYLDRHQEQIILRGDARFRGIEDIGAVTIKSDDRGVPIRLSQLGEIDTGPAPRQGAMTRDGRGEIVGASVIMLKGQNSREVVTRVKAALEELRPRLPAGVAIDTYYDRAEFINAVIGTIGKNLGEGAIIVMGCLLLTLGSIRAGLLVAGAIPFSMLAGFIGLRLIGYSGNVMSLGAVDFGIIVEGAVLSVEHAMTHGACVPERERRKKAILKAMLEVGRPALFVVAITGLVFLPLSTLEEVEGKMFRPVVFSLCFMLLGAIIYALVFLPAIGPLILRSDPKNATPAFARWAKRVYAPILDWTLGRHGFVLAASAVITIILVSPAFTMGADFLPRVFEGSFAIDALRPPSTSLGAAVALGGQTERALKEAPEVLTVVNRIGRPEGAVDFAGPESSDVFVILKPRSEWRKGMTPETLMVDLSARTDARVPATINAFSQPIEMRVNDLIAGARSDVVVKVFGDDLPVMADTADKIRQALQRVPGATNVKVERTTGQPAIRIAPRRDRLGRLGISAASVLDILSMSRAGVPVGVVRENERIFDLTLRLGGEGLIRDNRDLGRLPIATREAKLVPLAEVAEIKEEDAIVQIGREQMRRRLLVQANVRGRDLVGFVKDADAEVAKISTPKSVEVTWGGQFQNFIRAKERLQVLVPVALVVIAVMLVITFRSVKYMFITVLNLPFAIAGGIAALGLRGLSFSIPAGVGFIALCGVSVCTGIVMTNNLLAQPISEAPAVRVKAAALASLRARLSTALIAAIGFIPAAIATGTGAEVQRPLATVVIGGLLASMILSLAALPAMLLIAARSDREAAVDETEPARDLSSAA